jgi:hypothetical protein
MALPTPTTKRLFTGADVATGAVFSAIGLLAFRPAVDPDVFWHLAAGKWIWRNQAIPKVDPFSWTAPGRAWIAHEWLTEAIWRVVYRAGGWGALVALTGLILMATFTLVHATARRLGAGPVASTIFTALSALAGLHTWNVRPQMISLAFSALFGYWFATTGTTSSTSQSMASGVRRILTSKSSPDWAPAVSNHLWWAPVVMLVWVNLHGGWVFGMAMLAAFAVATLAESLLLRHPQIITPPVDQPSSANANANNTASAGATTTATASDTATATATAIGIHPELSADGSWLKRLFGNRQPLPRASVKRSAGIFFCSLFVGFINPNGLKGMVYPFSYLGDNASTRYVNEWFAPSISKVQYWPFFVLLALFLATVVMGLRKLPLYAYAIGLPFAILAVQSARNVSQFAVFAAPFLAQTATYRRARSKAALQTIRRQNHASIDPTTEWDPSTSASTSPSTSPSSSPPASPSLPPQTQTHAQTQTQAQVQAGVNAQTGDDQKIQSDGSTILSYKQQKKAPANPASISNINRVAIVALVFASLGLGAMSLTTQANLRAQARIYPVAAVEKLLADPGTKLLNDYDWGGYLTHVAPGIPVSIDGRPDMYGDRYTDEYVAMWRAKPGWQARLESLKADRLLAKPLTPIATELRKMPEWHIVFEDQIAVLFARR